MILLVFLGILVFLLWRQLSIEGLTSPLWTSESGTDYGGNDISSSTTTLKECKKNCIADSTCAGITTSFSGEGDGTGTCWMKTQLTTGTPSDNRWTYKLKR